MLQQSIEGFRLSLQQQRVWLLQQKDQNAPYRAQIVVRLDGLHESERLTAALHEVVQRHEILRTAFRGIAGAVLPLQVVGTDGAPLISYYDLAALDAAAQNSEVDALALAARRIALDFEQNRPLRCDLIRLSDQRYILILSLPALCGDAVSLENLVSELSRAYAGDSHLDPAADDGPFQYIDYAEWQHDLLDSKDSEEERHRWRRNEILDLLDLSLPLENCVDANHSLAPATISTLASPELLPEIEAFIRAQNVSLPVFLLACWQILLWRLTNQPEILVGNAYDGRYDALDQSLGIFTTYVPLRFKLDDGDSFAKVIVETCKAIREGEEGQEYFSWDQLTELRLNGDRPPFPAIAFDFVSTRSPRQADKVLFTVLDQHVCLDRFKLRLSARSSDEGLLTEFHYDPAILSDGWVRSLSRQFHQLMKSALDAPQAPIGALDILGEVERRRLLDEFNEPEPQNHTSECIHELFEKHAERTPDSIALVFEDQELTCRELNVRANQLSHHLRRLGVRPEIRVGLCTHRSIETVVALLGILKAGAAYVPLDPAIPSARLLRMLADAKVDLLLTQEQVRKELSEFPGRTICLDTEWNAIAEEPRGNPSVRVNPANLAYIIYTSGSTGIPKAVGVEHRQLSNYVDAVLERLALPAGASFATVSTIAADLGNTAIFPALATGGTLHLISEERAVNPDALANYISHHHVDCLKIVPSHLAALMTAKNSDRILPRQRLVLGGEASTWNLIEKVRESFPEIRILNHYGPTETTVGALTFEVAEGPVPSTAFVPLGYPIAGTQVYLLDAHLQPVPAGVPGELFIAGEKLARGYLNAPEVTAERFVPHHFSDIPGQRLYRTGDLARRLADGNIEFLGRVDHQVKINGFRIEPGEIEAALSEHASVGAATVLAREDVPGEKRLVAYVVGVAQHDTLNEQDLRGFLKEKLPPHMIPSAVVVLNSLPLTANGKVDRRALPVPEKIRPEANRVFVPPQTENEKALARIWAQVLDLEQVGIHDNFFALGGDSIRSIRVLALAQDRNLRFSMQQLFQHQTIYDLARSLGDTEGASTLAPKTEPFSLVTPEDREILPLEELEDAYPLAKLQEGMLFHSEFSPGSSMYHDITSIHLKCRWDFDKMHAAIASVTARHPVLRTAFNLSTFSEPLQLVYKSVPVPLKVEDLRSLTAPEQERIIDEWLELNRTHRFRWHEPPLLSYKIHRRTNDSFQFTLSRHHSIIDGWSTSSLFTQLFQQYLALIANEELPLEPALALTYRDFVALEQQALRSEAAREFWVNKLSDGMVTTLPALSAEADGPVARVGAYPVTLPHEVSQGLQRLAQSAGLPLKDVLLAAHARVLSLVSGQSDIVTGLVMHGRPDDRDGERVLGLFLNTLPLRMKLNGGSWLQLAREAFEAELELMPHRRYPLAAVQSDLGGAHLFETGMIFINFHVYRGLDSARNEIEPLGVTDIQETNFKFMAEFSLSPFTSEVELNLRLDQAAFTPQQIESFISYYLATLTRMATDPSERYELVCLLPEPERQQIIEEWNDTETAYPQDQSLPTLIEAQVERQPEAVAVVFGKVEVSYRELNKRANQLARYLQEKGVGPETPVGVCLERSVEMIVVLLGILKAGGAYVPLDPGYPEDRLRYMLEDSKATLVIADERSRERFAQSGCEVVTIEGEWEAIQSRGRANPESEVSGENLAYVIYTSGSTGRPKGVMVTHANVINFFTGMDGRISHEAGGAWLAVTSISFDISVLELWWTLARGFKVVIQSDTARNLGRGSSRRQFANRKLDFSLFYFASDESETREDKYELLIEGAKFADRNGFTAVWTPERHFHAFGGLYPNPAVTSAVVAAITQQIQIRAGSVVLPLHNPIRVAEEWSVVDNVSKGRVGISFASGWHADDFVLAPENFTDRKDVMMRDIETVRRLWRGESVLVPGPVGNKVEVKILPRPVQGELPVWLTAAGNPETFRLAGEIGANLLTHLLGQSIEELAEKIAIYREFWQRAEHGPGQGHVTLMLHTFVGEDFDVVREKVRQPFGNYLKSSVGLVQNMRRSLGYDLSAELSEADLELITAKAFDRYFETSGLMGTPETCLEMVDQLKGIGVDEVGCLIDFGLDHDSVMKGLNYLNLLKDLSRDGSANDGHDYSVPAQIAIHAVSHLQCTPSMAKMLAADAPTRDSLGALKYLFLGGEELPSSLVRELQTITTAEIHNMYGPTETAIWSATHQVKHVDGGRIPVGRPIANTEIYILDKFLQPVPVGTPGDLYIGGIGVVRGYLQRADLTADKFRPDPFSRRPGARFYATGDRARFLQDGTIDFLGRLDKQVKIRGFRIELEEIENALIEHPAILDTVVVASEYAPGEKQLVAYLTSAAPIAPHPAELRAYLKDKLPEYMLPAVFVPLAALPLTPNGKINRVALREMPIPTAAHSQLKERYVAPRTVAEEVVAGIWEGALGLERIGVHDNFFELGGNSLLAIRIIARLREVFQIELPLRGLFETPTVEGIVNLAGQVWGAPEVVEQIAETLKEIDSLSPDEVERMMLEASTATLVESA
jgi:natural product biosynthesis luciferase-like monooxygenase protein/amino acid adenylation domain-containing protein